MNQKYIFRFNQIILFYALLFWLGVMLLTGNLLTIPLIVIPRSRRQRTIQGGISFICRTFLRGASLSGIMQIDLVALDQLNERSHTLLVPNHPTMIDAFLVLSRIPNMICVMKSSISANIFLGFGAHLAGYVSNRRPEQMFRSAIEAVKSGKLLLIFPEGTRTTELPVNRLQGAVGLIAKKANAPLQTIVITTNSNYLTKGWSIWKPPTFPLIYRAVLGELILPDDSLTATVERLQTFFDSTLSNPINPDMSLRAH